MKLIQRIGYYLGGFSIGLIILAFFLNGKKTSCSYGPESRVLKNIKSKKISFSGHFKNQLLSNNIDSLEVINIVKKGDIYFSESEPRREPCGIYVIGKDTSNKTLFLTVENCDSIVNILELKISNQ